MFFDDDKANVARCVCVQPGLFDTVLGARQPTFFHVGHASIRSETHKGLWSRKREIDFPRKDLRKRSFFDSSKKKKTVNATPFSAACVER